MPEQSASVWLHVTPNYLLSISSENGDHHYEESENRDSGCTLVYSNLPGASIAVVRVAENGQLMTLLSIPRLNTLHFCLLIQFLFYVTSVIYILLIVYVLRKRYFEIGVTVHTSINTFVERYYFINHLYRKVDSFRIPHCIIRTV